LEEGDPQGVPGNGEPVVESERLAQAVTRLKAQLAAPSAAPADLQQLLNQLVGQVRKPAPLEVIQAGVGKEGRLVRVEDAVYFESDSRYTSVVYNEIAGDGKGEGKVLIRTPLKELIAQLDAARFWQIHRSTIVNCRHIASALRINEGNMVVTLRGRSERLPVSRHFQGLFRGQ